MGTERVKIIHISDMHLFVDKDGNERNFHEIAKSVLHIKKLTEIDITPAVIKRWGNDLNSHSQSTLEALLRTIRKITKKCTDKVILVNSGDFEAYGHSGNDSTAFPAIDYWKSTKAALNNVDHFIEIYGNHDLWMGSPVHSRPNHLEKILYALRRRSEFSDAMPTQDIIKLNSCRLEFYRLNTVCTTWPINTFAIGKIQTDYPIRTGLNRYPLSNTTDPVKEMVAQLDETSNKLNDKAIRLIVMHHPPHHYKDDRDIFDLISGKLLNRKPLIKALEEKRFHFIIAGHRHTINPPSKKTPLTGRTQKPLPENTIQLVAGSATQKVNKNRSRKSSFNLYELEINSNNDTLTTHRTIFHHLNDADSLFIEKSNKHTIINDMKIS